MGELTQKQLEQLNRIDVCDEQLIQGNIDDSQHEELLKELREI